MDTTFITLAVKNDGETEPGRWDWGALTDAHTDVVGSTVTGAPLVTDPLTQEQAEPLKDEDGHVTVLIEVDLYEMLDAVREAVLDQDNDHFDYLHGLAFDFGIPNDCSMRVIGVRSNGSLVVEYVTFIEDDE